MLAKKVSPALFHNYFSIESHVLLQVTLIVAAQVFVDISSVIRLLLAVVQLHWSA